MKEGSVFTLSDKGRVEELRAKMSKTEYRMFSQFAQSMPPFRLYATALLCLETLDSLYEMTGLWEVKNLTDCCRTLARHFRKEPSDFNRFIVVPDYEVSRYSEEGKKLVLALKEATIAYRDMIFSYISVLRHGAKRVIANPNKKGLRYKVAVEVAKNLSSLWFVTKVTLFGSVAAGTEADFSDIDLAIELLPCIRYEPDDRYKYYDACIKERLDKVKRKYGIEDGKYLIQDMAITLLNLTATDEINLKLFNEAGFFDCSVVLFERKNYTMKLGLFSIDTSRYMGYARDDGDRIVFLFGDGLCFFPGVGTECDFFLLEKGRVTKAGELRLESLSPGSVSLEIEKLRMGGRWKGPRVYEARDFQPLVSGGTC